VTLKWQQVVYLLAAAGMLVALVMPLSSEPTGGLAERPALLAATVVAALLYAAAAFAPLRVSIAVTLLGVLLSCYVTLALLRDATVAGYAASGFWLAVVASWIAAWAGVAKLASVRPADKTASRLIDLAIPLLFGAFLFYLWEVTVRGFGVPAVRRRV
jgi:NitT/TauT family transport system permease protein